MRMVAAIAAEALRLCGIPAQLEGNLIRVSTGLVGVNEACSGVRSLQTSIMIGLLFGELRRFDFARRTILLLASVLIALAANLFRAFFLVWIAADRGIDATSKWHDWTGYSIVICVFAASIAVAALLARGRSNTNENASGSSPLPERDRSAHQTSRIQPATSPFLRIPVLASILIWLLLIEVSAEAWYRSQESKMLPRVGWSVRWPESAPQFRDLPLDEKVRRASCVSMKAAARFGIPEAKRHRRAPAGTFRTRKEARRLRTFSTFSDGNRAEVVFCARAATARISAYRPPVGNKLSMPAAALIPQVKSCCPFVISSSPAILLARQPRNSLMLFSVCRMI